MHRIILTLAIAAGLSGCTVVMGSGSVTQSVDRQIEVKIPERK